MRLPLGELETEDGPPRRGDASGRVDVLRDILELDPSGVALLGGPALAVRLSNPAFRSATPDPAADPAGRTVEEIWASEGGLELRATLERVRSGGQPARFERLDVTRPDGRRFAYQARRLGDRADAEVLLIL